jgi:arylsulfatase A-like enzyme
MDDAMEVVVDGYKNSGLWNDTVLVFSTDNVRGHCCGLSSQQAWVAKVNT